LNCREQIHKESWQERTRAKKMLRSMKTMEWISLRMRKKETRRKKNIGCKKNIKKISCKGMGVGFEKGKIKEEEKSGIERMLMETRVEMNQEEQRIQESWPMKKEVN
jgi:hypothetical protein